MLAGVTLPPRSAVAGANNVPAAGLGKYGAPISPNALELQEALDVTWLAFLVHQLNLIEATTGSLRLTNLCTGEEAIPESLDTITIIWTKWIDMVLELPGLVAGSLSQLLREFVTECVSTQICSVWHAWPQNQREELAPYSQKGFNEAALACLTNWLKEARPHDYGTAY